MIIETSIYLALIIALLYVCDNDLSKKYYVPLKTACSASFLLILGLNIGRGSYGWLFAPLAFCFAGDLLMGLYNTGKKKRYVAAGLFSFLLAHCLFIGFMEVSWPCKNWYIYLIPLVMPVVMLTLYKLFHFHMGKILYPGLLYCYFISTLCLKSLTLGGGFAVAGSLFFLSDFSIMFLYFYHFKDKKHKKIVHYFNLVTYYFAILLFVYSR